MKKIIYSIFIVLFFIQLAPIVGLAQQISACESMTTYDYTVSSQDCSMGSSINPNSITVNGTFLGSHTISFRLSNPNAADHMTIVPVYSGCPIRVQLKIYWNPNFIGKVILYADYEVVTYNLINVSEQQAIYCVNICGNAGISMSPNTSIIGAGSRTLSVSPRKGTIQWYSKSPTSLGVFNLIPGATDYDYVADLNAPGTYEYYATQSFSECDASRNSVVKTIQVLPTCVQSSVDGTNNTTSIIASNSEGANAALTGPGISSVINGGFSNITYNSSTSSFESNGGYKVNQNGVFTLNLKGVTDFSQHYDVVFNSNADIVPNTYSNNSSYQITSSVGSYRFSFKKKNDGIDRSGCPVIPDVKVYVGGNDVVVPSTKCQINLPAYLCQLNPPLIPNLDCTKDIILQDFSWKIISQKAVIVSPGIILSAGAELKIQEVETPIDKTLPDNKNNWNELTVYDDYGNTIGATRSYFDAMGRPTQSQVKNLSTGVLIVNQTLYDQFGRPSLTTLPAPVAGLSAATDANGCDLSLADRIQFEYKSNFVQTSSGGAYTYKNFDGVYNSTKEFTPDPIKKTVEGTLGWYYSANNIASSTSSLKEPYVVSTDYPFSKTEFYNDGTQEVKRVVPPGNVYRGTNYKHVTTSSTEAITANDADVAKWLQMRAEIYTTNPADLLENAVKNKVIDEHGVEMYTISDKDGKDLISVHMNMDPITQVVTKTYSFNYYDDIGRLLYSITPNGVEAYFRPYPEKVAFASIDKDSYEYNHRGWLLASNEIDAGRTEYKYKQDGTIRFSQNAKQRISSPERYSYINYDALNRPFESGEYIATAGGIAWASINSVILENRTSNGGLIGGAKSEVVFTFYDGENGSYTSPYEQDFVMGNISCTVKLNETTTWYSYDERGRVVWTAQYLGADMGIKKIEYTYDPMGGVKEVAYHKGHTGEEFYHAYEYYSDGKLKKVSTSTVAPTYDASGLITNGTEQAEYKYYLHGPLKRVELADNLQGLDYLYTVEGWLKAINNHDQTLDPGADGNDVFGMALLYYKNDFVKDGLQITNPTLMKENFNGNISATIWQNIGASSTAAAYSYEYDSKSQLRGASWSYLDGGNLNLLPYTTPQKYYEGNIDYDLNGNIKTLQRNNSSGSIENNFGYLYEANSNKLTSVTNVGSSPSTNFASYTYTPIGELRSVTKGVVTNYVMHNVNGLMTSMSTDENDANCLVKYFYDENCLRYKKRTFTVTSYYDTYYIHDVSGNNLAVYDNNNVGNTLGKTETFVFGNSRIGRYSNNKYVYELNDHLGNVRAVVGRNMSSQFDIVAYTDYYPFGMELRNGGNNYRYGYQGQFAEKDDETELNSFELRMYDPIIGRWLGPDIYRQFYSGYVAMGNNPVNGVDPDGGFSDIFSAYLYKFLNGGGDVVFDAGQYYVNKYSDSQINEFNKNSNSGPGEVTCYGNKQIYNWDGSGITGPDLDLGIEWTSERIFSHSYSNDPGFRTYWFERGVGNGDGIHSSFDDLGEQLAMVVASRYAGPLIGAGGKYISATVNSSSAFVKFSSKIGKSRAGQRTFSFQARFPKSNLNVRLDRGFRSPGKNTTSNYLGKPYNGFNTHINIQKPGSFNYHLPLNPLKWGYYKIP